MRGWLVVLAACSEPSVATTPPPLANTVPPPIAPDARDRPSFAVLHALPGLDLVESRNHAIHTHGGPPADIDRMTIRVRLHHGTHVVKVTRLELLSAHCNSSTWSDRDPLQPTHYALHDWDHNKPVATGTSELTLAVRPDLYAIHVHFATQQVYNACDRFGYAVTLLVDRTPVQLELPLTVEREEPTPD